MTYPMPPGLLEQLGLEPPADGDPQRPEDHNVLAWGKRAATTARGEELSGRDRARFEEERHGS